MNKAYRLDGSTILTQQPEEADDFKSATKHIKLTEFVKSITDTSLGSKVGDNIVNAVESLDRVYVFKN